MVVQFLENRAPALIGLQEVLWRQYEYIDSFIVSAREPQVEELTFNGFSDLNGGGRIDYLFVSDGTVVSGYEARRVTKDPLFISDHRPVIITLNLR